MLGVTAKIILSSDNTRSIIVRKFLKRAISELAERSNNGIPESATSSVDAGCKSLISICFSKIAGTPLVH
jgi:hypothetical protein